MWLRKQRQGAIRHLRLSDYEANRMQVRILPCSPIFKELWYNNNMNDKIDMMIKYYEDLIEELNADQYSNPSYLMGKIYMAEEFISDLKGLKKEIQ